MEKIKIFLGFPVFSNAFIISSTVVPVVIISSIIRIFLFSAKNSHLKTDFIFIFLKFFLKVCAWEEYLFPSQLFYNLFLFHQE